MFTNTKFQRTAKATRFIAVAALLAVTVPGAALAQGGRGGGGGGDGGGGGGALGNPVLKCLGPECINVSKAQVPPCTANYCREEKKEADNNSCEVRVCKLDNGRRNCRIEVSYDERICIKHKFL
jgi:hypothetical protein